MGHTKTSERKKDHIELAFNSVELEKDNRFYYEPLFTPHPKDIDLSKEFAGSRLAAPIWVSSMTGGTKEAGVINRNLAKAVGEFNLGMGLGSCRIILNDDTYLKDFQLRQLVGEQPLYANLGIAQLEELFAQKRSKLVTDLITKTETDGLIIHVNPLQEWLQPEGDRFQESPLDTIKRSLDLGIKIIVKEVGQGFGPHSMLDLIKLPLAAIDFGAHGGTNFSKLELHRADPLYQELFARVSQWGHDAEEMVDFYNALNEEIGELNQQSDVIISGGVKSFVDGYYLTEKIQANAIYGQASAFLRHSRGEYEELQRFVALQIEGLKLANNYLKIKE